MRFLILVSFLVACGPSNRNGDDDDTDAPPILCADGAHQCSGAVYQICVGGQWTIQEECQVACADTLGCVNCQPNDTVCQDGNVHSCDANGNVGGETEACTGANICESGQCVDACASAAANKSYIGCSYMAADLDNAVEVIGVQGSINCAGVPGIKNVTMQACGNAASNAVQGLCDPPGNTCPANTTCKSMNVCILDAQNSPFAIVVSNPQARPVNVTVTGPNGQTILQSVAAGAVAAIKPNAAPNTIPDQSIDGTGLARKAYKVTSDLPIVAYQFNPLDNVNVFSNDASLLLPTTAYDVEYYNFAWPTEDRRPANHAYHGYVSIVAAEDDTIVEVTPSAGVRASATQAAIAAGTPTTFTIDAFEVLTLQAVGGGDLTGTKVRSVNGTTTFGVFGGHEAMGFGEMTPPDQQHSAGPCCADHIEEMLFPTSTWGKTFAITRSKSRGTNEPDLLRIMAQKPNTTITFDPSPASGTCGTLQPGQFCEVKIQGDTGIVASEPVLIAHYLLSAIWSDILFGGSIGEGDPSFSIAVPVEQYRKSYTVLVPSAYSKNFLSISAPGAGAVIVDGLVVQLTPYAGGLYRAARMQVNGGQHVISCPNGCGVEVYGYSDAVSYIFAGGLDLKKIVLE
ncbi:MAG: IgGFc-binding protein [Deltaproteobacteria bacterium]|nr:IgGFc-binding protein [Deltaproteobacteria bacterium]